MCYIMFKGARRRSNCVRFYNANCQNLEGEGGHDQSSDYLTQISDWRYEITLKPKNRHFLKCWWTYFFPLGKIGSYNLFDTGVQRNKPSAIRSASNQPCCDCSLLFNFGTILFIMSFLSRCVSTNVLLINILISIHSPLDLACGVCCNWPSKLSQSHLFKFSGVFCILLEIKLFWTQVEIKIEKSKCFCCRWISNECLRLIELVMLFSKSWVYFIATQRLYHTWQSSTNKDHYVDQSRNYFFTTI